MYFTEATLSIHKIVAATTSENTTTSSNKIWQSALDLPVDVILTNKIRFIKRLNRSYIAIMPKQPIKLFVGS